MGKQMTSSKEMVHSSTGRKANWHSMDWDKARSEVRRLQMRIAKAVKLTVGLLQPGQPFEMLEPYDGKLSRTVLRRRPGRKPRELPDRNTRQER